MGTKWIAVMLVLAMLPLAAEAGESPSAGAVKPVVWRGGYRFCSAPPRTAVVAPRGATNYGYRGSNGRSSAGRTSALDYPSWTQPEATRRNQWNKYPNQPYYLRGERKSLLILP